MIDQSGTEEQFLMKKRESVKLKEKHRKRKDESMDHRQILQY